MRKFLISVAVAASAVALASPASAQYFPQPQGNAYGHNNYGQLRNLQLRIDQIQRQIERLDRRNILSNKEARRLRDDSRDLERRVARVSRNGLNFRERQNIEMRIARLEQRVRHEASDGDRRFGQNGFNGRNGHDRDRDGRDDRYEDDHGRRHD